MARYLTTRRRPGSLLSTPSFRLFEEPFRWLEGDGFEETEQMTWVPATEVVDSADEIVVTAETPGMTRDDVEIEIEEDMLRIHGEKKEQKETVEEKDGKVTVSERRYGSFTRVFSLPSSVDVDEASAEMSNGVLTIRLPKTEMARGRKIEVKGS